MIKYLLLRKSRKRTNILDDDESGVFWTMFLLFSSRRFIGIDGLVCSVRYLSSSVQAKLNCLISELRHQYLIYASHAILYHNKSIENKISSRRFFFYFHSIHWKQLFLQISKLFVYIEQRAVIKIVCSNDTKANS